jgi:hypothetical protein
MKMGRKLTKKEKENKQIKKVLIRIRTIEKTYGIDITRRACNQYYTKRSEEKRLEKQIEWREEELERLKKSR